MEQRFVTIGEARVAYLEEGSGEPALLLHGCPFGSFVWRDVMAQLGSRYRCLAPDLLGLGDTETEPGADWSLRAQAAMVTGFLDALKIGRAHVVGHDHGGAIAQVLAAEHPQRIGCLVLCNAEAYDNWPSREEKPFLVAAHTPVIGKLAMWLWSRRQVLRSSLVRGAAVCDSSVLTDELLDRYIAANLRDGRKREKTRRFLIDQMDPANRHTTLEVVEGLRRFDHPTLLLWGADDPHFGPQWARRLREDLPGFQFLTRQAARYPTFTLITGGTARELVLADGAVRGVRYRSGDRLHEIRAALTVGADGRSSTVRREANLPAVSYGSAIDVLWLRLPRRPGDPEGVIAGSADGLLILAVGRGDRWQLGLMIPKGGFGRIRTAGLERLRETIAWAVPVLADRVTELANWRQVAVLSVRADRLTRWHRPGLLLIGDAAHVMSPAAGNGINYAVADAVADANILAAPLKREAVTPAHLAAVQRRRDWPTRITQFAVARAQNRLEAAFSRGRPGPPVAVRLALSVPFLRRQAIRMAAYGLRPERLNDSDTITPERTGKQGHRDRSHSPQPRWFQPGQRER